MLLMIRRFSIDDGGRLVSRDGTVLGKVVSISLEIDADSPLNGGVRGGYADRETKDESNQETVAEKTESGGGSRGNQIAEPTRADEVRILHATYVEVCQPARSTLSPSRERMYRRALNEADLPLCQQAIHGLKAWQARKGGDLQLSRVFQTRPNGKPLGEQIEFFASQAPNASRSDFLPSEVAAEISQAKRDVIYGASYPDNALARQKAEVAEATLAANGIKVIRQQGSAHVHFIATGGAA